MVFGVVKAMTLFLQPRSGTVVFIRLLRTFSALAVILSCEAVWVSDGTAANEVPSLQTVGSFGSWTLYCKQSPSDIADCALAQAAQSQSNDETAFALSISFDKRWNINLKMKVQPVPIKTEGIALLVDRVQVGVFDPSACDSTSCTAAFVPTAAMLASFMRPRAQVLEAEFRSENSAHGISIGLDLPGLQDGLLAMDAKLRPADTTGQSGFVSWSGKGGKSEFTMDIVNVNDIPKGAWVTPQSFSKAEKAMSALIPCNRDGNKTSGEMRPPPVSVSVNAKMELVDYTHEADSDLDRLADITHRCGSEYAVAMISADDHAGAGLFQIQKSAVENVLAEHGISKLVVPDFQSGVIVYQSSHTYLGARSFPPPFYEGRAAKARR